MLLLEKEDGGKGTEEEDLESGKEDSESDAEDSESE